MSKILNKKFIIIISLIFGVIYYYFYNDSNVEEDKIDLAFLYENKNIEKKDFALLLESIMPKREKTPPPAEEKIESKQDSKENNEKEKKEPQEPLKLLAMINDVAYITNGWYKKNDTIIHNDIRYIVAQINDYDVLLVDSNNKSIKLEMFELSEDIFFKIH